MDYSVVAGSMAPPLSLLARRRPLSVQTCAFRAHLCQLDDDGEAEDKDDSTSIESCMSHVEGAPPRSPYPYSGSASASDSSGGTSDMNNIDGDDSSLPATPVQVPLQESCMGGGYEAFSYTEQVHSVMMS